jgi:hypothetical protein
MHRSRAAAYGRHAGGGLRHAGALEKSSEKGAWAWLWLMGGCPAGCCSQLSAFLRLQIISFVG